ncbi:MAG: hypothetical protein NWT00_02515, partial [Beijerinckiaceae bacterium]|nr:hypothetical protein [Beijerinckiaceae bacterium]
MFIRSRIPRHDCGASTIDKKGSANDELRFRISQIKRGAGQIIRHAGAVCQIENRSCRIKFVLADRRTDLVWYYGVDSNIVWGELDLMRLCQID